MAWTKENKNTENWLRESNTGEKDSGEIWASPSGVSLEGALLTWSSTRTWTVINWTKEA